MLKTLFKFFLKLNEKFFLGTYLRIINKNKYIKKLIQRLNPFSNKFNF
jgi:hypothetical protein